MERESGLKALGLSPRATSAEVESAYRARSRALKHKLLNTASPEEIARFRNDLRRLVILRDVALGKEDAASPSSPRLGVTAGRVIESVSRTSLSKLDRSGAREFFQVSTAATDDEVRAAYELCKRALVRRYVRASDKDEIATIRRTQGKLRTIRNYALDAQP